MVGWFLVIPIGVLGEGGLVGWFRGTTHRIIYPCNNRYDFGMCSVFFLLGVGVICLLGMILGIILGLRAVIFQLSNRSHCKYFCQGELIKLITA